MKGLKLDEFECDHLPLRSIQMTRPNISLRVRALAVAITLGLLAVLSFFLPWQQTAVGTGRVIAYSPSEREQQINAPVSGRIARWHVAEGQTVRAGDPIVDLADIDPNFVARLKSEREALERRLSAAQQAVNTARRNRDRQKELFEKGLSARKEFEKSELDYMGYLAEEAEASAALVRMDVSVARQMNQQVTAPIDGAILRIVAGQGGQIVKQGDLLTVLVPTTATRTVELWLDGNDLPLVEAGRRVRLQFEGWPAIQFSGWPSVAVGTFGGEVALVDAMTSSDGKFRVFIQPTAEEQWPETRFLRQGVRVNGWVLLSQVSLGYEIWRQLNGFPPNLSSKPPKEMDAAITFKKK